MYAFPRIDFSEIAIDAATKAGKSIEVFYCLALLEETGEIVDLRFITMSLYFRVSIGIITAPGDGFGQIEGTHHFRMTILPDLQRLKVALSRLKNFHINFSKQYSN